MHDALPFAPRWWMSSPHAQTLWAALIKHSPAPDLSWHRLELADSDFVDLCFTPPTAGDVVLVLHGLEGSIRSGYARALLYQLQQQGFNAVLYHFRGCSGEPNRLPRRYHFGDTGDLPEVFSFLQRRYPGRKTFLVGYSLGGNVALKWLGETGIDTDISATIAISVPFNLHDAAERLNTGFSKLYQRHLLNKLKSNLLLKADMLSGLVDLNAGMKSRNFREYDDRITAPLHGFQDVNDYYDRSTCLPYLNNIQVPAYILHSHDDPFMWPRTVPGKSLISSRVSLRIEPFGGHVGYISSDRPLISNDWLEQYVISLIQQHR